MERVERRLNAVFADLPIDHVHDAVIDATIDTRPAVREHRVASYSFLYRAAWRNAANAARTEARRKVREAEWSRTAFEHDGVDHAQRDVVMHRACNAIEQLIPDAEMLTVFRLRYCGEKSTEAFARALSISHLPSAEQKRRVKKQKDRLDKFLLRSREVRRILAAVIES